MRVITDEQPASPESPAIAAALAAAMTPKRPDFIAEAQRRAARKENGGRTQLPTVQILCCIASGGSAAAVEISSAFVQNTMQN